MQKLIKSRPQDFPLRSSLFYKDQYGQPCGTWAYLCKHWWGPNDANISQLNKKQTEYNSNCMTFMIFNMADADQGNPPGTNPFVGDPTAKQIVDSGGNIPVDDPQVDKWTTLLDIGKRPDIYLVPTLFCGDDGDTTNNTTFYDWFIPKAIQYLKPFSKAINITSEATKTMKTRESMERMIKCCKDSMLLDPNPLPVGVHIQWNFDMNILPRNGDFLMYEYSWHPSIGNNISVQKVVDESNRVLDLLGPGRVWFEEMNWDPESIQARRQAAAVAALPGVIGLPGPV